MDKIEKLKNWELQKLTKIDLLNKIYDCIDAIHLLQKEVEKLKGRR